MSQTIVIEQLRSRGVEVDSIVDLVYQLQAPYHPGLTREECRESVMHVLAKREVMHAVVTGIAIDRLAEQGLLPQPLQTIMDRDEPLYGVDEILALAVTNVYGSIGLTNFGYLDKTKPGIIGELNRQPVHIHVFLDDLVAAIVAAASARFAHQHEARSYIESAPGVRDA
ncbi:MAG: phosphatidylglycerophosphatase A [Alicyclobacillaceae bacterium]|nr:phosphatidylglycerophosphatase A [Alicyclobacillaceae bacterium]